MKEDICVWYQWLEYEEGFDYRKVPFFLAKKKQIDNFSIISAPLLLRDIGSLVRMGN